MSWLTRVLCVSGNWIATVAIVYAFLGAGGCASPRGRAADVGPQVRRRLYGRVVAEYSEAYFFKPGDRATGGLEVDLVPLIVQQVSDTDSDAVHRDWFGGVQVDAAGLWSVDSTRPTIYAGTSMALLNGRAYQQVVYVWVYPRMDGVVSGRRVGAQGVRITLDAEGFPIIWEVLGDDTGAAVIYIADWLEDAAAREFGAPLRRRRFAIERSIGDRPNVVVARSLAGGPVPMGPFVYLVAGTRAVSTVICRCMPSQVEQFRESAYYDLQSLERLIEFGLGSGSPLSDLGRALSGEGRGDPTWLERCLRLPREF